MMGRKRKRQTLKEQIRILFSGKTILCQQIYLLSDDVRRLILMRKRKIQKDRRDRLEKNRRILSGRLFYVKRRTEKKEELYSVG